MASDIMGKYTERMDWTWKKLQEYECHLRPIPRAVQWYSKYVRVLIQELSVASAYWTVYWSNTADAKMIRCEKRQNQILEIYHKLSWIDYMLLMWWSKSIKNYCEVESKEFISGHQQRAKSTHVYWSPSLHSFTETFARHCTYPLGYWISGWCKT